MNQLRSPGLQLVAIGIVHNGVGLSLGAAPLRAILADGVVGAVDGAMDRMAIFWFVWFGWMLVLLGAALRTIEPRPVPLPLIVGIAAMTAGGIVAMPASGFWLAALPIAGMLASRRR